MTASPLGVLLMAYGTPRSPEEIKPYYTHIRHGRPPTAQLLADLTRRYEAIGGLSPLNEITQKQAQGLEQLLNGNSRRPVQVFLGMKHNQPFIEDAVAAMVAAGIEEAIALVLAPHYSAMSVGSYLQSAREAAAKLGGPVLHEITHWHLHPQFIQLLSNRVAAALAQCHFAERPATVIFSAHSLPERILATGDVYPQQLQETADAVGKELLLPDVRLAWQSAGRTSESWLGPDILEVLRGLKEEGQKQVVICSAGFVADHLEVLYDIDIECRDLCQQLGLHMVRTASMNADPDFLALLATLVEGSL